MGKRRCCGACGRSAECWGVWERGVRGPKCRLGGAGARSFYGRAWLTLLRVSGVGWQMTMPFNTDPKHGHCQPPPVNPHLRAWQQSRRRQTAGARAVGGLMNPRRSRTQPGNPRQRRHAHAEARLHQRHVIRARPRSCLFLCTRPQPQTPGSRAFHPSRAVSELTCAIPHPANIQSRRARRGGSALSLPACGERYHGGLLWMFVVGEDVKVHEKRTEV